MFQSSGLASRTRSQNSNDMYRPPIFTRNLTYVPCRKGFSSHRARLNEKSCAEDQLSRQGRHPKSQSHEQACHQSYTPEGTFSDIHVLITPTHEPVESAGGLYGEAGDCVCPEPNGCKT